jgi:hypothetical protein
MAVVQAAVCIVSRESLKYEHRLLQYAPDLTQLTAWLCQAHVSVMLNDCDAQQSSPMTLKRQP